MTGAGPVPEASSFHGAENLSSSKVGDNSVGSRLQQATGCAQPKRLSLLRFTFREGTHPCDVVLSLFAISTANPLPETLLAPRTHTDKFSAAPCAACPAHGRNRDDGVYKSETKQKCHWITQRKRDIGFKGTSSLRQGDKQALPGRSGCAVCHRRHERKAGSESSILHSV
jgi:hypothetical protein